MANHNLSKIKGIVFDLDDTLYPQVEYKRSGFKVVASWLADKKGVDSSTVLQSLEAILNQFGASYPYMFDRLAELIKIGPHVVPEMVRRFIEHKPRICCYDGVIPMLTRLKNKYRLGILTDGRLIVQQKKIDALGLTDRVDEILCSDLVGLEKPATELFQWFEDAFRLNGENLIYVGDNPHKDFYGANQQEWSTVRVMSGEYRNETSSLIDFCAQYEIKSIVGLDIFLKERSMTY